MALSASQQLTVCKILGITPSVLEYQLTLLDSDFDSDRQTAVETEITRWTTAGAKFTKIHPREKNFGAEINPGDEKQDIRKNIALLLEMDLNAIGGGSRLVRA